MQGVECASQKLASTLNAIESEYDRRLSELLGWRLHEISAARALVDRANFSVGTNQFHIDHGRNACTAAATAAALYVLSFIAHEEDVRSMDVMPNLPWDTIVTSGTRLWLEYAESPAGKRNPSGHVEFDQLLACGGQYCGTVQRAFEIIVEIAGHTDDVVVAAMDKGALPLTLRDCVMQIPVRGACIITATSIDVHGDGHGIGAESAADARSPDNNTEGVGSTVVVMRLADDSDGGFWIYDSHGNVDTEHAALLCHCKTPEATAVVLSEQLPVGLYCAVVFKRKRLNEVVEVRSAYGLI